MAELTHSYFRGEVEEARELQLSYLPLMKALFSQVNPIPIKAAMAELGLDSGSLRRPLWAMDKKPCKELRETLAAFGLLSYSPVLSSASIPKPPSCTGYFPVQEGGFSWSF